MSLPQSQIHTKEMSSVSSAAEHADPLRTRVVVIGGAGNVGKGIVHAFRKRPAWSWSYVIGVDPNFEEDKVIDIDIDQKFEQRKCKIEDMDNATFQSWLDPLQNSKTFVEFIVTNDDGNRDNYAADPTLESKNNARFHSLVNRIAAARDLSKCSLNNVSVHISYIGGSWTRRQADLQTNTSKKIIVNDSSPVKPGGGSNPYERAKTSACQNAQELCAKHGISITFYDYISIVPNFNSNFSIHQMIRSSVERSILKFSPGDFGRPLLHANEAGEFVARFMEAKFMSFMSENKETLFEVVLVPGHFVTFQTFADLVLETIEKTQPELISKIELEAYKNTPDELKARCISSLYETMDTDTDIKTDSSLVLDGLRETAHFAMNQNFDNDEA